MHISNSFLLVVNNMMVEEGNKLQNCCDVLRAVARYCKLGSETSIFWMFKFLHRCKQCLVIIIYLLLYQPWDLVFWLGSFLILVIISEGFALRITAQKMKFSIQDFFSKGDQIRSFLRISSYLLKKSLMESFIFYAVDVLVCIFIKNLVAGRKASMYFGLE